MSQIRNIEIGVEKQAIFDCPYMSASRVFRMTQTEEKKAGLAKWKAKVGEHQAKVILRNAIKRGNRLDADAERILTHGGSMDTRLYERLPERLKIVYKRYTQEVDRAFREYDIQNTQYCFIDHDLQFKGIIDLDTLFFGAKCIVDVKTARSRKNKVEWIEDNAQQVCSYAYALGYEHAHLVYRIDDGSWQRFSFGAQQIQEYWNRFYQRKLIAEMQKKRLSQATEN